MAKIKNDYIHTSFYLNDVFNMDVLDELVFDLIDEVKEQHDRIELLLKRCNSSI